MSTRVSHLPRTLLAISTIISSWLLMQVVHESGHTIGAAITGGTIRRIVLVPWELSRTELIHNPKPLFVCWAGPILGVIIPCAAWSIGYKLKWRFAFWLRFLAGFCLVANGAYIAVGAFTGDGDAGEMIRDGSPVWTLLVFGVTSAIVGFLTWHNLGRSFGFGTHASEIHWKAAMNSLLVTTLVITVELILAKS